MFDGLLKFVLEISRKFGYYGGRFLMIYDNKFIDGYRF